jgi:hypothetical protein
MRAQRIGGREGEKDDCPLTLLVHGLHELDTRDVPTLALCGLVREDEDGLRKQHGEGRLCPEQIDVRETGKQTRIWYGKEEYCNALLRQSSGAMHVLAKAHLPPRLGIRARWGLETGLPKVGMSGQ